MAKRFETLYQVKRRDNLGDPGYWNLRLQDIDRRVDANETALASVDDIASAIEGVALDRINNVVTPLVQETFERIKTIPNLFSAASSSTVTVALGDLVFYIDQTDRATFAHQGYVRITPPNDFTRGMLGAVTSYNNQTGELDVHVEMAWGDGTFSLWNIVASLPAEAHLTAAQLGAPTIDEMNLAIAAATAASTSADNAFAISMAVAL